MRVVVYEVVRVYEIEVEGTGALAMRDAVARVESGAVPASTLECRHIAFPATSRVAQIDPRDVLRALSKATPEARVRAAREADLLDPQDPKDPSEWLAIVLRRAIAVGKLAALDAALRR